MDIAHKVTQRFLHRGLLGFAGTCLAGLLDEPWDFVFEQSLGPAALPGFVVGVILADQRGQHLAGVFQGRIAIFCRRDSSNPG